jgi:hypothetical protein
MAQRVQPCSPRKAESRPSANICFSARRKNYCTGFCRGTPWPTDATYTCDAGSGGCCPSAVSAVGKAATQPQKSSPASTASSLCSRRSNPGQPNWRRNSSWNKRWAFRAGTGRDWRKAPDEVSWSTAVSSLLLTEPQPYGKLIEGGSRRILLTKTNSPGSIGSQRSPSRNVGRAPPWPL